MNILAIGAHYDDIELSAGGTLAKMIKQGHNVYAIITSASNYTSYNNRELRSKEQSDSEGLAGLFVLGFRKDRIINLQYPTKKVPFDNVIVEKINKIIDDVKPDIIITHHPYAESHQDHINTAKSVMAASRYQNTIWVFEPLYPSKLSSVPFKPTKYVDISDTLTLKIASLKAHKSQWRKYPHWNDLVKCLARVRGIEINTKYAESFEIIKDNL